MSLIVSSLQSTNFRVAAASDVRQIANLHAISWQNAYKGALSDDYLTNQVLDDRLNVWCKRFMPDSQPVYRVLLATQNEELVGFISIVLSADQVWGALIDNLHVHPNAKRTGIGRALMSRAALWVKQERPNSRLHLFVYETNISAHAFYNKLGGQVVERLLRTRPDGHTDYSLRYAWYHLNCLT